MHIMLKDIVPAALNNIHTQFIILDKGPPIPSPPDSRTCLALAADETAAVHLLLWGPQCDALEAGDIVRLTAGIFSFDRNTEPVLRTGRRGKMEKTGEFTLAFVETPNVSEIRWKRDPSNQKLFIQDGVISPFSRIFPPMH